MIFLYKLILMLFSKEKIYIERVTGRKYYNQESKLISLQSKLEVSSNLGEKIKFTKKGDRFGTDFDNLLNIWKLFLCRHFRLVSE